MFKPFPIFVGLRYTRAKRRSHFVSFISFTSMLGLILGVMVMILVLSVMNGFDREMRERVLGMIPQATIETYQPIDDWQALAKNIKQNPEVIGVAPFLKMQGMLSFNGQIESILANGIDPQAENNVSIISQYFTEGTLDDLVPSEFGIIIGSGIAKKLNAKIGNKITYIMPEASVTPAGIFPRMKRFTVKGIFHAGTGELDNHFAMVHIQDANRLVRLPVNQTLSLRLQLKDLFQANEVAMDVLKNLPNPRSFYATTWKSSYGGLYQAIRLEKNMIGMLLLLIVAVAAFNIISTLVMVVTDKKSDIAILRTLGATPTEIMSIFMVQGTIIGVIGTFIGGILGVLAALKISNILAWIQTITGHQFLNSEIYFIDYIPSQIMIKDVVIICGAALLLSFLATLYPAWRAARIQPAEALRYE